MKIDWNKLEWDFIAWDADGEAENYEFAPRKGNGVYLPFGGGMDRVPDLDTDNSDNFDNSVVLKRPEQLPGHCADRIEWSPEWSEINPAFDTVSVVAHYSSSFNSDTTRTLGTFTRPVKVALGVVPMQFPPSDGRRYTNDDMLAERFTPQGMSSRHQVWDCPTCNALTNHAVYKLNDQKVVCLDCEVERVVGHPPK